MPRQIRYAIIGVGARSRMYQEAIHERFEAGARLVACADLNRGRLELARGIASTHGRPPPEAYLARDLPALLSTRPDCVIVTTPDFTHADYVCGALMAGADVIVEKPMATDAEGCRRVLEAVQKSGRRCRVAFNYRYSPVRSQLKELLMGGIIGDILSVDFHWMLDTFHGADYFRRWHARKENSGGLLVHKATHHFDLVNWWLSAAPTRVWAQGKREFYRPQRARALGLSGPHERCHTCPERSQCPFALELAADADLRELYLEQEQHDGYFRDRCVFRPEIDIEDTMNAIVEYDSGVTLSYSLNAFCSWEGYAVAFNGSRGRIEHRVVESTAETPYGDARGAILPRGSTISVQPLRSPAYAIEPRASTGGHGGGDRLMLAELLGRAAVDVELAPATPPEPDPLLRAADERSGALSILVGIAANHSMQSGAAVRIAELVPALSMPRSVRPEPALSGGM